MEEVMMVRLLAGYTSAGVASFETIACLKVPTGFRLLSSAALCYVAADDVVAVEADGTYTVIERGGNVAIQIVAIGTSSDVAKKLAPRLHALDGRIDSVGPAMVVATVPVSVGFPRIEHALEDIADWAYGNVYDPGDGVTPLNWWH